MGFGLICDAEDADDWAPALIGMLSAASLSGRRFEAVPPTPPVRRKVCQTRTGGDGPKARAGRALPPRRQRRRTIGHSRHGDLDKALPTRPASRIGSYDDMLLVHRLLRSVGDQDNRNSVRSPGRLISAGADACRNANMAFTPFLQVLERIRFTKLDGDRSLRRALVTLSVEPSLSAVAGRWDWVSFRRSAKVGHFFVCRRGRRIVGLGGIAWWTSRFGPASWLPFAEMKALHLVLPAGLPGSWRLPLWGRGGPRARGSMIGCRVLGSILIPSFCCGRRSLGRFTALGHGGPVGWFARRLRLGSSEWGRMEVSEFSRWISDAFRAWLRLAGEVARKDQ
jgi:hypothetical protein